jgi:hypothetical protein
MSELRPMNSFDPDKPAILHDRRSDTIVTWTGEDADNYRLNHVVNADGSIEWNGRVFDGWGNVLGG